MKAGDGLLEFGLLFGVNGSWAIWVRWGKGLLAALESMLGGGPERLGLKCDVDERMPLAARPKKLFVDLGAGAMGSGSAGAPSQRWSAIFEISISAPQSEHLMDGRKLIGLAVSAMVTDPGDARGAQGYPVLVLLKLRGRVGGTESREHERLAARSSLMGQTLFAR